MMADSYHVCRISSHRYFAHRIQSTATPKGSLDHRQEYLFPVIWIDRFHFDREDPFRCQFLTLSRTDRQNLLDLVIINERQFIVGFIDDDKWIARLNRLRLGLYL